MNVRPRNLGAMAFAVALAEAIALTLYVTRSHAAEPVALTAPAPAAMPLLTPLAPSIDGPIAGFGDRLPMSAVLPAVIPGQFSVYVEPGIDEAQLVSWQGGASWHHALETALAPLDLVVSYSGNRVEITRIKIAEAPAPSPIEVPLWERTQTWYAAPNGQDLRDAATAWGQQCGIEPVFVGDYTYPVEAPLHFKGNCTDAMNYLVRAFSTASPPPIIHQWSDEFNYAVQIVLGNH